MARKRMIDPEFWSDDKITNLDIRSRLLFIGLWNFADDDGIIKARADFVKSVVFPFDDVKLSEIERCMESLREGNLIFPYINQGQRYAIILNFRKHQVINKPLNSKLPKPSIQNREYHEAIFTRDNWTCHLCGDYIGDILTGSDGDKKVPSIDHLIPQSKGGTHLPNNIKTACLSCNKSRGNKELPECYRSPLVLFTSQMNRNEMKGNEMNGNSAFKKAGDGDMLGDKSEAEELKKGREALARKWHRPQPD